MPYSPVTILASAGIITILCLLTNVIFAYVFEAPTNIESVYITALILTLIIAPPLSNSDVRYFILAGWASVWAMASKYIFALRKKHIFNPAAFAVALTALTINQSANWWVSAPLSLMPFIVLGGFLVVRKLRRSDLVVSFIIAALVSIVGLGILGGSDSLTSAQNAILISPLLFFAFVMLTEPLTTPPTKVGRIFYGMLVGLIFAPKFHIGSIYSTPELALLTGNIMTYLISPKEKLILALQDRLTIGTDMYDFIFKPDRPLKFKPGQYLEWTLPHKKSDSRGNRRYFTIASSPTEKYIRIGVKFYPEASSFKKTLGSMAGNDTIIVSQLAGEFVMPKDKNQKLVFIAGGIGVTPFRSMIKYLLDTNEKRQITVLYSNQKASDIVYADVFEQAQKQLGIKTIYTLTDVDDVPASWNGRTGYVDAKMIMEEVPDYGQRTFYISGSHSMVSAFTDTLKGMGVKKNKIKTDFFPGFV